MESAYAARCGMLVVGLALCTLVQAAEQAAVPWQAAPKVDHRGYIDVWQLRADVAHVEARIASPDTDRCFSEGDPEEPPPSAREIKRQLRQEATCVKKVERDYQGYQAVHAALNRAWIPILRVAIENGDLVAEVILRQCETTAVLDRSWIESTCDDKLERRAVAVERLNRIGFLPATDDAAKLGPYWDNPLAEPGHRELKQLSELKKVRGGALGFDKSLFHGGGNSAKTRADLDLYQRWYMLEAVRQDAPRAFTFDPGSREVGWRTGYAELRLVRKPATPGYMTRGQMQHHGGGNDVYTGPSYWRRGAITVYGPDQPDKLGREVVVAGMGNAKFDAKRKQLLAEIEANIDRYMAADPRWGVFLLKRIGHHEWVPQGTQSTTHKLDSAWLGQWVLEKESFDWSQPMTARAGWAKIGSDGEYTRVTIEADSDIDPFLNLDGCLLRYSGGMTFLPRTEPGGAIDATNTVLGYHHWDPPHPDAVAPFHPRKRYKQVLMQCANAEHPESARARFLFLVDDRLVEFGYGELSRSKLAVRHYRRLKEGSERPMVMGSTDPDRPPAGGSWIADANGCRVMNPIPVAGESVSWSGTCKNGWAYGAGVLYWFRDGKPNGTTEGNFRAGKLNGRGRTTYPDGYWFEGEYVDGLPNGDGVIFDPEQGEEYFGRFANGCAFSGGRLLFVGVERDTCKH